MVKIDKKIVGYSVNEPMEKPTEEQQVNKEFDENVTRPDELDGKTYKIPDGDHSIYVTINDIEHDGEKRPFEIFIKCDDPNTSQWTSALSRILSALLRKGGKFEFICEELRAVHSPSGGRWQKGTYFPSQVAMIGEAIERHFVKLGYKKENVQSEKENKVANDGVSPDQPVVQPKGKQCPECKNFTLVKEGGCEKCHNCGFAGECG